MRGGALQLDLELHAYHTGFLDVKATVTNESAPMRDMYAAVVCRWEQPKVAGRTLCYDNRRQELKDGGYSPFREGEGRHLYSVVAGRCSASPFSFVFSRSCSVRARRSSPSSRSTSST